MLRRGFGSSGTRSLLVKVDAELAVLGLGPRQGLRPLGSPTVYYVDGRPKNVTLEVSAAAAAKGGCLRPGQSIKVHDHRPEAVAAFARLPQAGGSTRREVSAPDELVEAAVAQLLSGFAHVEAVEKSGSGRQPQPTVHLNLYPARTPQPLAAVAFVALGGTKAVGLSVSGEPLWRWESAGSSRSREHWYRLVVAAVDRDHTLAISCGRVSFTVEPGRSRSVPAVA